MTAGASFLVLFSTNRDEEQVWIIAGDGLSITKERS
jgi:hypothetical protein